MTATHLSEQRKLPPVLPIVLYNGEKPWQASESISRLLQPMPEELRDYQPQQRYLLIDEGRYSATELEKLDNVTAALIQAEIAESQETLSRVLLPCRLPGTEIEAVHDLTEMQACWQNV
jgi:hypothetical protein